MRQTLLNFRSPCEHSGEFRLTNKTHLGQNLAFGQKSPFN